MLAQSMEAGMVEVANYFGHDITTDKQVIPKRKRTVQWIKANWREPLAGTIEDVDAKLLDNDGFYYPSGRASRGGRFPGTEN